MKNEAKNHFDYGALKVLVIDDDKFARKTISTILLQIGFTQIKEAPNGQLGLEINAQYMPDLIVCDLEMTPVNGLMFLKRLRADSSVKNCNVPVIFLTGHKETKIVMDARDLGVDAFVLKPPSLTIMKQRIDTALRRKAGS